MYASESILLFHGVFAGCLSSWLTLRCPAVHFCPVISALTRTNSLSLLRECVIVFAVCLRLRGTHFVFHSCVCVFRCRFLQYHLPQCIAVSVLSVPSQLFAGVCTSCTHTQRSRVHMQLDSLCVCVCVRACVRPSPYLCIGVVTTSPVLSVRLCVCVFFCP